MVMDEVSLMEVMVVSDEWMKPSRNKNKTVSYPWTPSSCGSLVKKKHNQLKGFTNA